MRLSTATQKACYTDKRNDGRQHLSIDADRYERRPACLQGHALCVAAQNLIELWAVATRSTNENGLGFSVQLTSEAVDLLTQLFMFLPDTPAIYAEWRSIVGDYKIFGKPTHDARLLAATRVYGETSILAFDKGLSRYSEIKVTNPNFVTRFAVLE